MAAWAALALLGGGAVSAGSGVALETVVDGLARPVGLSHAGDGSGRLFIALLSGELLIFKDGELLPAPFLDLGPVIGCCGNRGLLGFAFHPQYAANGELFVSYTDPAGDSVVARYLVSEADPDLGDPASGEILLTVPQPSPSHNGNHLAFGPEGYLYAAFGDGGLPPEEQANSQDLTTLLGKLLRIDIDGKDRGLSYAIPPDNPYVGDPAARDEIWASGLRNPWRFSFDRETGDLFIGDVGLDAAEEINAEPAAGAGGLNYGWPVMEGSECRDPPMDCNDDGSLELPLLEYTHSLGCSVTAGYRYRGLMSPALEGVYVFGDYCSGRIWGVASGSSIFVELLNSSHLIVSFGEDEAGEIYLLDYALDPEGGVYRLTAEGPLPFIFSDNFESGDLSAWGSQVPFTRR